MTISHLWMPMSMNKLCYMFESSLVKQYRRQAVPISQQTITVVSEWITNTGMPPRSSARAGEPILGDANDEGPSTVFSPLQMRMLEEILQQRVAAIRAEEQAANSGVQPTPTVSLRDLNSLAEGIPIFSGDQRRTKEFVDKVEDAFDLAKITTPPTILSNVMKVSIITMRLSGDAHEFVQALRAAEPDLFESPDALLKRLANHYKPVDRDYEAAGELKTFRQGTQSVSSYATAFRRLLRDVPTLTLEWQNMFFLLGLNGSLSGQIRAAHPDFKSMPLTDLITLAIRLTSQQRSPPPTGSNHQLANKLPYRHVHAHSSGPTSRAVLKPGSAKPTGTVSHIYSDEEIQAFRALEPFDGYKPSSVAALHASMDPSANPDGAKLKDFCKHHNLCFRCRIKGHGVAACPQRK